MCLCVWSCCFPALLGPRGLIQETTLIETKTPPKREEIKFIEKKKNTKIKGLTFIICLVSTEE